MSSMRVWIYQKVSATPAITGLLPGGIHPAGSMDNVPKVKPFLAIRASNEASEIRDGGITISDRQQFTFWVHDRPGNYEGIDSVLEQLRLFLEAAPSDATGFMKAEWLFTSDDLRDDEMGTIARFVQYQITRRVT